MRRFSVFGWFLQPGQLYELFTGEEEEMEQQIAYRQRSRAAAEAANGGLLAAADAAAVPGLEDDRQEELDGAIEPQRCKLGQRLLARARARQQQRAAG